MAAHGEIGPMPDCAIFADTGWEPKAVYDHLAWLMSPNVLPFPVPIPAPLFAVAYLVYSWYASRFLRGRVNHDAHIGGAIFGLAFVALTDPSAWQRAIALTLH
jgi:membrane associated rhomboid family serine protease